MLLAAGTHPLTWKTVSQAATIVGRRAPWPGVLFAALGSLNSVISPGVLRLGWETEAATLPLE